VAVGVLQSDNQLELVSDFDAMVVDILNALFEALGQIELLVHGPAILACLPDHVGPVLLPRHAEGPVGDFALLLMLSCGQARGHALSDLEQLYRDVAHFEALEERGESHLERDGRSEDDSLLGE